MLNGDVVTWIEAFKPSHFVVVVDFVEAI